MSAPVAAPLAPVPPSTPPTGEKPSGSKRTVAIVVGLVLLVIGLVVALAIAVIVGGGKVGPQDKNFRPGDPANYGVDGGAALAETLKTHGVKVTVARTQRQVRDFSDASSNTVVVVSGAGEASKATSRILLAKSRGAKRIVLLGPTNTMLPAWGVDADVSNIYATTAGPAGCNVAGIHPEDSAGYTDYAIRVLNAGAVGCFRTAGSSPGVPGSPSAVVVLPATGSRPEIVIMPQLWFTNNEILNADHAGIGVRVLGAGSAVNWFAPDQNDKNNDDDAPKPKADPKLKPDVPPWVWPMIWLGFFVMVAVGIWRGRRFGQLVAEPLPAVVKAAETTEARGRLYQSSGDAARAAAQLREHALRTIPRRLGVSRHAPIDDIVAAVSRATGRAPGEIHALLVGPLPTGDAGLVQFAANLSTLEEEVRPAL
ncbi:DUF4350 domain-containing protein [Gordonia sp. (in: high G+C Gram-positive bacteria)]|uniref:DUF4350 domain-containing protein n=1 Tax=Gordonia sp. (in: high G+C Gram-positive bacteria) TaxID=84139 RepID=UPI0039E6D646